MNLSIVDSRQHMIEFVFRQAVIQGGLVNEIKGFFQGRGKAKFFL